MTMCEKSQQIPLQYRVCVFKNKSLARYSLKEETKDHGRGELYQSFQGSPLSVTSFQVLMAVIAVTETGAHFMDDSFVFAKGERSEQVQSALQKAKAAIQKWARTNHIFFNTFKCKLLPSSGSLKLDITFYGNFV
jgi:hypothetical protein